MFVLEKDAMAFSAFGNRLPIERHDMAGRESNVLTVQLRGVGLDAALVVTKVELLWSAQRARSDLG